ILMLIHREMRALGGRAASSMCSPPTGSPCIHPSTTSTSPPVQCIHQRPPRGHARCQRRRNGLNWKPPPSPVFIYLSRPAGERGGGHRVKSPAQGSPSLDDNALE